MSSADIAFACYLCLVGVICTAYAALRFRTKFSPILTIDYSGSWGANQDATGLNIHISNKGNKDSEINALYFENPVETIPPPYSYGLLGGRKKLIVRAGTSEEVFVDVRQFDYIVRHFKNHELIRLVCKDEINRITYIDDSPLLAEMLKEWFALKKCGRVVDI